MVGGRVGDAERGRQVETHVDSGLVHHHGASNVPRAAVRATNHGGPGRTRAFETLELAGRDASRKIAITRNTREEG